MSTDRSRPVRTARAGRATRTTRSDRVDRRLVGESAAARRQFAVAGGLGTASAAVIVAQAALLAHVISAAAMHRASLQTLRGSLVALGLVIVARALLTGGFEFSGRLASWRVLAELRRRLARQLLLDRPGRRPHERTGELAAAAVQGVDSLESYFAGYLPSLVLACLVPVAVLGWVVPVDPVTALILAATIPVLVIFMILIGLGAQARTRRRWQALALLSSHFLDVVRGLETLRAHRREHAQAQTLREVGERYRSETMGTLRLAFMSSLVLELCAMMGTALVAATIGVQLTAGHLTLDAGLTVLLLTPELYSPLRQVGQQFHASADGLAAAGRLLEVLDEPPALAEPSAPAEPAEPTRAADVPLLAAALPTAAALHLDAVSFSYPSRPGEVLTRLELTVLPGEFLAVVGPSGAGKSTLAALLLRLADPTSGSVRYGDLDLRDIPAGAWRARLAWVPQRTMLFSGTIAENIALAAPDAALPAVSSAAREAGLEPLLRTLPAGLGTRVGDGGRILSAGQRQRVALARAFLSRAPLVVLDEPTANLDRETADGVGEAIARLAQGRTTVLITHDSTLAARADRRMELSDGRLLGSGSAVELAA